MPLRRVSARPAVATAILAAVCCSACVHDSTDPATFLSVSAASRTISLREDSLGVRTDSALVLLASTLAGASWTASHGAAPWLTLLTPSGTGTGALRWRLDLAGLSSGTWVDTITITVPGVDGAVATLLDSVTVRDRPAQYIAVRRAWRPGERDSVAASITRTGALGEFSDVAALAVAQEDSAVDIVLNPAWRPPGALVGGVRPAPLFQAGWGMRALDILVVYDSLPDDPAIPATLGIQRDSLDWISVRWWNPADSTWKGWLIAGTSQPTFGGGLGVNTAAFNASGLHSGVGGGEARLASLSYWEATGGTYKVSFNGGYGAFSQITSGAYLNGDLAVGWQKGDLVKVVMPRQQGSDAPDSQTIDVSFKSGNGIPSWQIVCYFAPVPPVAPFHQCTGPAAAAIVAAARAGRMDTRAAARPFDPLAGAVPARRRHPSRRRQGGRSGPLLAEQHSRHAGGAR